MSNSKRKNNSSPEASRGSITLAKLIPVMGTLLAGIIAFALYVVSGK